MYSENRIKAAHLSADNTFWLNNGDINDRDEIDIIENNSNPSKDYSNDDYPWQVSLQHFFVKNGKTERAKGNFDNDYLTVTSKGVTKRITW